MVVNKERRYLFYVKLSYSYAVLRPIEKELKSRGYKVAWFIPKGSEAEKFLLSTDFRLKDISSVIKYNSDAVLAPGNYVPDFFPGIKVQMFHGFDSGKKNKFNIRGFFDLYCTQGPNITNGFEEINDGTCEITETGWCKLDPLFSAHPETEKYQNSNGVILYAPTFSPKLTSSYALFKEIEKLVKNEPWHWIVKLHPKATSQEIDMYRSLEQDKLKFVETGDIIPLLQAADVLLSDTSSILAEFALQDKPVVAFNSRRPEPWMINFTNHNALEEKLNIAFNPDPKLMNNIKQHKLNIHPYQDGMSSKRAVDNIDAMIEKGIKHLKRKPLNLIRRIKMRKKFGYYRW